MKYAFAILFVLVVISYAAQDPAEHIENFVEESIEDSNGNPLEFCFDINANPMF